MTAHHLSKLVFDSDATFETNRTLVAGSSFNRLNRTERAGFMRLESVGA